MSGTYFAARIPFPFVTERSGRIDVTEGGTVLQITNGISDLTRANVLMLQNVGPNVVYFALGPYADVSSAEIAAGWGALETPLLPGAIITYPVASLSDMAIAANTAVGETAVLYISRGWGQ